MSRVQLGALFAFLYLLSIVGAAWAVGSFGVIPVGLSLMAPAGAYFIGVTMVLRDLAQDYIGPKWTAVAMLVGAALSAFVSPTLALASAASFLISEAVDMAIYTPLRKRSLVLAALLSNAAGIVLDSFVFLYLAFGSLDFFLGQSWAKAVSTVLAIVVLKLIYRRRTTATPAYLLARQGIIA